MLSICGLGVQYGAVTAVREIDLDIREGEIVALLGANGAGKTTIARAIAGLLPFRGEIRFRDQALKPNSAEHNLRAGISLVPEGRGILARMTVEENLLMGIYRRTQLTRPIHGPALIEEDYTTVYVAPGWRCTRGEPGDLIARKTDP